MRGCNDLVPARPLGASWCGAHDLAGNVHEWVITGQERPQRSPRLGRDDTFFTAIGGSFRDSLAGEWPYGIDHRGREFMRNHGEDDVGFRVALSAV